MIQIDCDDVFPGLVDEKFMCFLRFNLELKREIIRILRDDPKCLEYRLYMSDIANNALAIQQWGIENQRYIKEMQISYGQWRPA